ncbi:von Willebrand factor A domain-containing protein 5B1 isoform 2 [Daubentonia madagascariensis]|uniref:von Willebrand factor A domain-containing protein 5B1 isoform 2 n=1 Tax=Daubentonia madagascariensis TaxID=31869 RepID=A0ABD2E2K3_DAUMA
MPSKSDLQLSQVALDEDLERILFVVNLGTIAPMENVAVFISTSSELPTLPSGAVRVLLPAVCAPTVPQFCTKSSGTSNQQAQGKDRHCFGTRALDSWNKLCLATLLDTDVSNPMEYEFNFQLEIRGPCLLAGVESPTHEIRADAAPTACSAKSIIITLANKHTFDRPVEILIHPSEPHMPHILMEKGDMTLGEFEQHLRGRTDFIKGMKKDSRAERKTEIIRKRLHKDIPHHSVLMLNFCPDLQSVQPNLRKTHGEFIFLIDRSSSMSGTSIHHVKEAMLVALKSLMPACLFNVIGFGSTFKTLFPSSQTYSEESLAMACDNIQRMRADMGGTNILSPLKWVIRQPVHQGHPRLVFLITDGAVNNTGKVLELVRNHAFSTRCYSFGIGPNVCHRLVKGLASVSKGSAEFLVEGERLQPKMVKSLKKAMAPVLSDVTVEWIFPETTEVLISPVSTSSLFPGERLVGYGIVCDASLYISNPRSDKRRRYSMLHSQESSSSVFYRSQDEGPGPDSGDCAKNLATFNLGQAKDARSVSGDSTTNPDLDLSQRRRAYSTNQITNHKPCPRATTASYPTVAAGRYPLRKARLQDFTNQTNLDAQRWQIDLQPLLNSGQDLSQGPKLRGPGARRPSLLPQGCQPFLPSGQEPLAWSPMRELDPGPSLKPASDSRSPGDLEPSHHPSTFETETSSDWEPLAEAEERASPGRPDTPGPVLGKALVKGLRDSQRVQWEVSFELGPPRPGAARRRPVERDLPPPGGPRHYPRLRAAGGTRGRHRARVQPPLPGERCAHQQGLQRHQQIHSLRACGREQEPVPAHRGGVPQLRCCIADGQLPHPDPTVEGLLCWLRTVTDHAQRRLSSWRWLKLNRSRLLTRAAKGFLSKPLIKAPEPTSTSGSQSFDYIPLVSLQLASGAFLLNRAFCEAIHIPMEKLKWTSPFTCHRASLTARQSGSKTPSPQLCTNPSPRHPSCDSFSLEPPAEGKPGLEPRAAVEHAGKLWATVVGLAWLEHSSASYFTEWELVAAKANSWLEQQEVPEGRTRGTLKAAARQLFVLLRHWDENLEFDMLCYNPNYV